MAADRSADRHNRTRRLIDFEGDEWDALEDVAKRLGTSRSALVRECVLYLIGSRAEHPRRPD